MRRGTKVFLLAGCALVVTLDARAAFAALAASWRGPYEREADARTAAALAASARTAAALAPLYLELARR